jgi:hypothetical protein
MSVDTEQPDPDLDQLETILPPKEPIVVHRPPNPPGTPVWFCDGDEQIRIM